MQSDNSSEAYYNKGILEYEEGQYELSIENFKKAVEINDSIFDYHYNLGLAYIKIEEYDSAIKSFKIGIALNSEDSDIYLNLGLAFYSKGDFDKAAKAYKKAAFLDSTDPENFSNAGIAYCSSKKYKDAIFYFKQAIRLEPKNPTYHYNLAYVYYETESYDFAEDLAEICVWLTETQKASDIGEFINIGTGKDLSIKELAELIKETVGFKGKLEFDTTKPDGTPKKLLDVSKINALGREAKTLLKDGLKSAYEDFLNNPGVRI